MTSKADLQIHEYIKEFVRNSENPSYKYLATIRRFDEGTGEIPPHALRELAQQVPGEGDLKLLQALYAIGVDKELVNSSGHNALHNCCYLDQPKVLTYLLENGLRGIINARNKYDWTPANIAASCSPDCLKILISASASLSLACDCGFYPEHSAVLGKNPPKSLKILQGAGIDFSRQAQEPNQGLTPLGLAHQRGIASAIEFLESCNAPL